MFGQPMGHLLKCIIQSTDTEVSSTPGKNEMRFALEARHQKIFFGYHCVKPRYVMQYVVYEQFDQQGSM